MTKLPIMSSTSIDCDIFSCSLPTSAEEGDVYYLPENGYLIIERADSDNNGVYECTGTNTAGSESADTELVFVRTGESWVGGMAFITRLGGNLDLKQYVEVMSPPPQDCCLNWSNMTEEFVMLSLQNEVYIDHSVVLGVPWYISWYMWFIYTIVFWALTIPLFIGLFFCQKKRADINLPPPDGWIGT